jgi:hypothetical protein
MTDYTWTNECNPEIELCLESNEADWISSDFRLSDGTELRSAPGGGKRSEE